MKFFCPQWLTILAAVALTAMAGGCGRHETPVEEADREQILLVGNGADPATLDPQLITGLTDSHPVSALFEGLTTPDPQTLEPRPGMAQSWEYDDKTLTWTFHLRPEAKWSNGDPVTASDFVFSYHRMLTPALGSEYANMLYPIKNAEAYNKEKLKDFSQVGVHAADAHTLKITLENPTSYFLALCYHQTYLPVHPPTITKYDAFDHPDSGWDKPGKLVGNGPFVLTKYVLGEVIEVKKNPLYWNAANVRLNGIRFYPISNINTEDRAFRNGLLHVTQQVPPTKVDGYLAEHNPYLNISPVYGSYFYSINTRKPPLNDPRVRRALSMALDRKLLAEKVVRGGRQPAYSLTPPSADYKPRAVVQEDVAAAKRLLAEAGYPDGKGLPAMEVLYNNSDAHRAIAEALQQMWKQNLGINVNLAQSAWPDYLNRRKNADFQIIRASWYADYLDPSTFLELFKSDNEMEQTGWKSDTYDRFILAARGEQDKAKRMEDFQQAEAVLVEESPLIPLYFYSTIMMIRPEVKGYYPNLLDVHPYTAVYLDPAAEPPKNQPP